MRRTTHFQQRIIRSCVCFSLFFFLVQFFIHTYPTLLYIWIEIDLLHELDVEPGMMHDDGGSPETEKAWIMEDGHYKFKNSVNRLKLLDDGYHHDFQLDRIISPVLGALQHAEKTYLPIIVWWTPSSVNAKGAIKRCWSGDCYVTADKSLYSNPLASAFLFNGVMFDVSDLPLPRKRHHDWGLLQEKSPIQYPLFSFKDAIELFNHTSTFKRESSLPLTTRFVESTEYLLKPLVYKVHEKDAIKTRDNIASVAYIQSECYPSSDRDVYVKELMTYLKVDSYGTCLYNKELPTQKDDKSDEKLNELLQKYKFVVAFENSICNDYVTEKLFRTLSVGSIPIYKGAPNIREWLPNNHSAIIVDDFESPKDLANYIIFVDTNVTAYNKYMEYKQTGIENALLSKILKTRKWGVHSSHEMNHETGFECHVCDQIHDNKKLVYDGKGMKERKANADHFNCQLPKKYEYGPSMDDHQREVWRLNFDNAEETLKTLKKKVQQNRS